MLITVRLPTGNSNDWGHSHETNRDQNLDQVPGAKLITNGLYPPTVPGHLLHDLVLVKLSGDRFIEVSWLPEFDLEGAYHISDFSRGAWETPIISVQTTNANEAASTVERFAEQYSDLTKLSSRS